MPKDLSGLSGAASTAVDFAGQVSSVVGVAKEIQKQQRERAETRHTIIRYLSSYYDVDARRLDRLLEEAGAGVSASDVLRAVAKEGGIEGVVLPFSLAFTAAGMGHLGPIFSWLVGGFVGTFGDGFITELGPNASWEDNREFRRLNKVKRQLRKLGKRVEEDCEIAWEDGNHAKELALRQLRSAISAVSDEVFDRIQELYEKNPW